MPLKKKVKTLEEDLNLLIEKSQESASLSIEEIFGILSLRGQILILIFLALPFCQPIQIPGFSTPFGILISFMGIRMAFGRSVSLPKRISSKSISSSTVRKISEKCLQAMKKIRRFIHPRLSWLCGNGAMQIFNGILIFFLGIFLALPLPIPFSNLAAGWSISLISIGILEDDGLFVLMGYLGSLITLTLFIFIIFSISFIF